MALGKTIYFKKLTDGGVSLLLQDVEGVLPEKWFAMDQKMPRIGIPENYALSLYINSVIKKMLDKNYFEIENIADLVKIAEAKGFIAPSEEEKVVLLAPKRSKETLTAIIRNGNEEKLRELFASADRTRSLDIATAISKTLSLEVIERIENILGMAITEE
jgi:hypothetical protein